MANKVVVVMPAYNAEHTLLKTYNLIPEEFKRNVLLVDDFSKDETIKIAEKLGINIIAHDKNTGYGGNQKTCYSEALKMGADIIVMLHPDYQYPPELIPPLVSMITYGGYDVCLGSRILCGEARTGHMPRLKYIANRILTFIENILTGAKLSEYHTGYRAYSRKVLESIPFKKNSNGYIFDNQLLLQIMAKGYKIGEISSPCRYFPEASSINFVNSSVYGLQCVWWGAFYFLGRYGLFKHSLLFPQSKNTPT